MRKLWRRLCFLVLAFSSVSRGRSETVVTPDLPPPTPPPMGSDETQNESSSTLETPVFNNTSANTTDLPSTNLTTREEEDLGVGELFNGTTEEDSKSTPWSRMGGAKEVTTTVSIETGSTSLTPGYVILVLIIVAIIILCVMLYFLRRVSRTYSFDLHRPIPSNHRNDPIGTFEPVYLDDLAPKDQGNMEDVPPPPPVSNGTTIQTEERESNGESAPQEPSEANGSEASPGNTDLSLIGDPAEKTSSPSGSASIFFDSIGEEQQNENNNNPSVCSSDPKHILLLTFCLNEMGFGSN
ncbi:Spectrin beta chain non-erythrocytic 1 [Dissostichus eleginoides]|uniref:Spectrin beta chain non-erythrocytic 1 n=1 Tax=Dissostichus eleginoides TaxID=100907 RepID=A0AAD9BVW1_DISEL|nr:Spectrin beta chain non-erythrocytic 1 [Dissostichus eleginoides]